MCLALVSDSTGEIVGVRANHIISKAVKLDKTHIKTEGIRKFINFIQYLDSLCSVFDHYNVEEVFHFLALGVHKDYRQRGIGTKMMKAAVTLVENLGLGNVIIKGDGTSNYSKRIFEKLGFDMLLEVKYEDYKENGDVVFKNMGEHKSFKVYGKKVFST